MKVIIDGTNYLPEKTLETNKELLLALEIRFDSDAGDDLTIREYLEKLLSTLWDEQEGFSGKRPFGNSGWEYDLYKPLIESKLIEGKIDECGDIGKFDETKANEYVRKLILAAFYGVKD